MLSESCGKFHLLNTAFLLLAIDRYLPRLCQSVCPNQRLCGGNDMTLTSPSKLEYSKPVVTFKTNIDIFDASDIDYLCKTFSIEQLRAEIKSARRSLQRETDWKWQHYYEDLIRAFLLAIDIIKSYAPSPAPVIS